MSVEESPFRPVMPIPPAGMGTDGFAQPEVDGSGHIIELQSMRGIAALIVLMSHVLNYYAGLPAWFSGFRSLVFNGQGSVVMFFVLSGFVLSKSILKNQVYSLKGIVAFYIGRIFRIYPAIFASSVLAMIFIIFFKHANFHQSNWYRSAYPENIGAVAIIASALAVANYIIPPLWSITVELLGSVLMPFFAYITRLRPAWLAMTLVGLLIVSFLIGPKTPMRILMYPLDFAMGAALCSPSITDSSFWTRMRPVLPALFLTSAGLLMATRSLLAIHDRNPVGNLVEIVLATVMVGSVAHGSVRFQCLRHPLIKLLGDISYSIYLVHFSIMGIAGAVIPVSINSSAVLDSIILAAVVLAATIPISWLMYKNVEMAGVRIGKTLALGRLASAR